MYANMYFITATQNSLWFWRIRWIQRIPTLEIERPCPGGPRPSPHAAPFLASWHQRTPSSEPESVPPSKWLYGPCWSKKHRVSTLIWRSFWWSWCIFPDEIGAFYHMKLYHESGLFSGICKSGSLNTTHVHWFVSLLGMSFLVAAFCALRRASLLILLACGKSPWYLWRPFRTLEMR